MSKITGVILEFRTPSDGYIKITTSSEEFAETIIQQYTDSGYTLMSVRNQKSSFFRDAILSREFFILILLIIIVDFIEFLVFNK